MDLPIQFDAAKLDDFCPDSAVDLLVSFATDAPWSLFDLVEMTEQCLDQSRGEGTP
jgi:predicted nucleotidyltransferase